MCWFYFNDFEILEHRNSLCHNHQVRLSKMTIEHIVKHLSLFEISCVILYKSLGFVVDLETLNHRNPKCHNCQIGLSKMIVEHTLKHQKPNFIIIRLCYPRWLLSTQLNIKTINSFLPSWVIMITLLSQYIMITSPTINLRMKTLDARILLLHTKFEVMVIEQS